MLKSKNKGFSLIVAISLVLVLSLLAIFLLNYIIPFSKNTTGVENGTKAYYEANKGIEDLMFKLKGRDSYFETGGTYVINNLGYITNLKSVSSLIPDSGKGNSEFNLNYNKISDIFPISMFVKGNINWNNALIYFKVPDLDYDNSTTETFTGGTQPIINWQLSAASGTINSSGSYILNSEINNSLTASTSINLSSRIGFLSDLSSQTFSTFYNSNNCSSCGCTLKLLVINPLITNDNRKIPYLEYKMDFTNALGGGGPVSVSTNNYKLETTGLSNGFKKTINLDFPKQSSIDAFDFTVFQ